MDTNNMKYKNKKYYLPFFMMIFLGASTMTVDAQDEVPNYPVLQELDGGRRYDLSSRR
ncbi:MAG: hypothetical protein ACI86M_001100 [Saprospiraceae bacterium]|jgi:hypothetical protein